MPSAMVFPLQPPELGGVQEMKSPEDRASYSGDGGVCGVRVSWSLLDTCLHPRFGSLSLAPAPRLPLPALPAPACTWTPSSLCTFPGELGLCLPNTSRGREVRGSPGEVSAGRL